MSDNVTELNMEPVQERRPLVRKIVILAVIVAAVCCTLALFLFNDGLNLDTVRRWGKYFSVRNDESYGTFSFDSHSSNSYANFDSGMAVASVGGLSVYDMYGEERFVLQKQIDLPKLLVNHELAVAYDVGGSGLIALHKNQGEVLNLEETHPILDADLSEKGAICLSSSASGYKSVLSVYNDEQDLIYRWLSSSTYFPLCAISPNGTDLAAVAVGQSNGTFESSLYLFRTDSEEIQNTFSLGNELIYDLMFVEPDVLCAIGESSVQVINMKGKQLGTYSYDGSFLKDFDCAGNGFLTLSMNMYRAGNRYSIVTVDEKGRKIADRYIGQEVLDLSACGRYIGVLTPGKLTIYTHTLDVYHETTDVTDATSIVMREDGSVLVMGGGSGQLYLP